MNIRILPPDLPWKDADVEVEVAFLKGEKETIFLQERFLNEAGDRVGCFIFVASERIADDLTSRFKWSRYSILPHMHAPILVAAAEASAVQKHLEGLFATV